MSDAPSNLPFESGSMTPPVRPPMPPAPPLAPAPAPSTPGAMRPPIVPRPPLASAPQDLFADVEPMAPQRQPPVVAVPPELPPPVPSSGHGKTLAIIALILFLVVAGAAAAWWGYGTWKARQTAILITDTRTPTSTANLPILPPPAQDPYANTETVVPLPGDNAPVQVVPLPTPVTTPPANTNIPGPTYVDPNAPVVPTSPNNPPAQQEIATSTTPAPGQTPSSPAVEFDSDGDGLADAREKELGTDPLKADTDGDTLSDGREVLFYGTNPLNVDTDDDGFPDGVEITNGFNPRGTGRCSKSDCRL